MSTENVECWCYRLVFVRALADVAVETAAGRDVRIAAGHVFAADCGTAERAWRASLIEPAGEPGADAATEIVALRSGDELKTLERWRATGGRQFGSTAPFFAMRIEKATAVTPPPARWPRIPPSLKAPAPIPPTPEAFR